MSWEPEARPDWVLAVNDGSIPPISELAELPFDRDRLLAEARVRLGLDDGGIASDFGGDGFLEPLDLLLPALEKEAELSVLGRWMTRRFLLRLLEVRLQIVAWTTVDPAVRDEVIEAPLFVTGVPRTGTSILHALLACDPANRVPEGWELLRPVPPPDPETFTTDARIRLADEELRFLSDVVTGLDAVHVYQGRMPKECLSAMSFEFRSEEFTARYHVPTYEKWLDQCDMTPAYESHRLVLQLLQRRYDNVHWVLKSPVHMHSIPVVLAVYPDARIAVTHRDPLTILPSVTSLVANLRWVHSDHVDFAEIGQRHARLYHDDLDGLVARAENGTLDPARTHHSHYADFMEDPIAVVRELSTHFDRPLDASIEQRMRDHLAANAQGAHGGHRYSFDDLGLDRAEQRARFARYQDAFRVPNES